ncbi:hypothetical protein ADK76_11270 [Streptomyces griseoflavus]|uniref:CPBP family intramembrane glutamic endopeptidase n=1 Tax=Streptomyces rimosus TaxID=1927 RepID=UPI0004C49109|nr:CPBP family intramembrane glutamic endopeptidase [Streptomyces rimosus]KOG63806.1 hypothetical protein ADK76_11270 [Streptomyces griseoflavus]
MFFGEELGRQGCLFPRPAGRGNGARLVWAYVGTGAAFALWHLPTLLMGGQYPGRHWYVSVFAMVVGCVRILPVFAWLRLRSGAVAPAVVGHTLTEHFERQADRPGAEPAPGDLEEVVPRRGPDDERGDGQEGGDDAGRQPAAAG